MHQDNIINLTVATVICQLLIDHHDDYILLKKSYRYQNTEEFVKPEIRLFINRTDNDILQVVSGLSKNSARLLFPYKKYHAKDLIFLTAVALSSLLLLKKDIIMIHASSIRKKNLAYVFCGPSGSGKSTIVKLAKNNTPSSDDITVIKKEGNKYFVYPSPFDKLRVGNLGKQKALLAKIFVLHQSDWTAIKPINSVKMIQLLMKYNMLGYINYLPEKNDLYKLTVKLVTSVPVQYLYFTKSRDFLKML